MTTDIHRNATNHIGVLALDPQQTPTYLAMSSIVDVLQFAFNKLSAPSFPPAKGNKFQRLSDMLLLIIILCAAGLFYVASPETNEAHTFVLRFISRPPFLLLRFVLRRPWIIFIIAGAIILSGDFEHAINCERRRSQAIFQRNDQRYHKTITATTTDKAKHDICGHSKTATSSPHLRVPSNSSGSAGRMATIVLRQPHPSTGVVFPTIFGKHVSSTPVVDSIMQVLRQRTASTSRHRKWEEWLWGMGGVVAAFVLSQKLEISRNDSKSDD